MFMIGRWVVIGETSCGETRRYGLDSAQVRSKAVLFCCIELSSTEAQTMDDTILIFLVYASRVILT